MKTLKVLRIFVPLVVIWNAARMYLDPGSGSFIIQILIAALLGAGLAFRGYWSKLVNLFKRSDSSNAAAEGKNDEDAG
jgi:hypothetical protein